MQLEKEQTKPKLSRKNKHKDQSRYKNEIKTEENNNKKSVKLKVGFEKINNMDVTLLDSLTKKKRRGLKSIKSEMKRSCPDHISTKGLRRLLKGTIWK